MFRGVAKLNVHTLGGGGTWKTCEIVQGRGGPKIDEIERMYFLNTGVMAQW